MLRCLLSVGRRGIHFRRAIARPVTSGFRVLSTAPDKDFTEIIADCEKSKSFQPVTGKEHHITPKPDYPFELDDEDYVPMKNPLTGEWNPPRGVFLNAEPTRFGDWEFKGRCTDF